MTCAFGGRVPGFGHEWCRSFQKVSRHLHSRLPTSMQAQCHFGTASNSPVLSCLGVPIWESLSAPSQSESENLHLITSPSHRREIAGPQRPRGAPSPHIFSADRGGGSRTCKSRSMRILNSLTAFPAGQSEVLSPRLLAFPFRFKLISVIKVLSCCGLSRVGFFC